MTDPRWKIDGPDDGPEYPPCECGCEEVDEDACCVACGERVYTAEETDEDLRAEAADLDREIERDGGWW